MNRRNRGHGFLSGLVFGLAAGAGLYYFLTSTDEGKKVKKKLEKSGKEALDSLNDIVTDFEDKGLEFKKKAKLLREELEEKAKDVKNEVAQEAKEQLVEIEKLRQKGQDTKKFFTQNGKSLSK